MTAVWIGPFEADEVTIGRDAASDVLLDDISVSRRHARLVRTRGCWEVVDLGSENGTWVGGRRVGRQPLRPGQPFFVGAVELAVALSADDIRHAAGPEARRVVLVAFALVGAVIVAAGVTAL